jgi:hypothetical protein
MLPHRRTWLLAIGQRLRAEYEAIAEPIPPRLAELVKQLENPFTAESNQEETGRSSNSDASAASERAATIRGR